MNIQTVFNSKKGSLKMSFIKQAQDCFAMSMKSAEKGDLIDAISFGMHGCEFLRLEFRKQDARAYETSRGRA